MNATEIFDTLFELSTPNNRKQYSYQRKLIKILKDHNKIIINKSRQIGISYWFALYSLLYALKGETVLIVSPSERQSKHFLSYSKIFLNLIRERIPEHKDLEIKLEEETKTTLFFKSGGRLMSLPNSPNSVRGVRADLIVFDEHAHFLCGTDKEMMEAILPSISRGGKLILISTPYGEGNEFYNIWIKAEKMGFKTVLINWKECPDLNIKEIREVFDDDNFGREYDNRFLGDSTSVFSYKLINTCVNQELIYDPAPIRNSEVFVGMDVGRHKDLSVVAIVERKGEKLILRDLKTWRNVPFTKQKNDLIEILTRYEIINLNIDKNGLGEQLAEELNEMFPEVVNPFVFSNQSKQNLVVNLKKAFEDKTIEIPDDSFLINSIHQIQRSKTQGTGYVRYDAEVSKETGHADAFWALALAVIATKGEKEWDFVALDL